MCQSAFRLNGVKLWPKQSQQPIMAKKITPMRANENSNNKARENAGDQVVVGFSFESDWLRKRRKFSGQIKELNQKQK